eukprot:TRINITY_DN35118_c0_g1_i1.p1 TRINITY_DN35118_c0_g1~~TRINITY_DN35118_c0_g1_i1.p1  ORF type:complete len:151 (+),score=39.25 TRINITY_DN35118_c0_g1_i1:107-559(+)
MHGFTCVTKNMEIPYNQMMAYVVSLPLLFAATLVSGQDDFGGGEDAGGGEDMMDMESMGIGSESGNNRDGQQSLPVMPELTYIEQSTRALQQLALVIGVAFMVAFLFLVMVGLEKAWDKMEEKYRESFGKSQQQEVDPAALVGTFKRYKN